MKMKIISVLAFFCGASGAFAASPRISPQVQAAPAPVAHGAEAVRLIRSRGVGKISPARQGLRNAQSFTAAQAFDGQGPQAARAAAVELPVEPQSSALPWTRGQILGFVGEHGSALRRVKGVSKLYVSRSVPGQSLSALVIVGEPRRSLAALEKRVRSQVPEISELTGMMGAPNQVVFRHPGPKFSAFVPMSVKEQVKNKRTVSYVVEGRFGFSSRARLRLDLNPRSPNHGRLMISFASWREDSPYSQERLASAGELKRLASALGQFAEAHPAHPDENTYKIIQQHLSNDALVERLEGFARENAQAMQIVVGVKGVSVIPELGSYYGSSRLLVLLDKSAVPAVSIQALRKSFPGLNKFPVAYEIASEGVREETSADKVEAFLADNGDTIRAVPGVVEATARGGAVVVHLAVYEAPENVMAALNQALPGLFDFKVIFRVAFPLIAGSRPTPVDEALLDPAPIAELGKENPLRIRVEQVDSRWQDDNIMNGSVGALSGRLLNPQAAYLSIRATVRKMLGDEYEGRSGIPLANNVATRKISSIEEGVAEAALNLAKGFSYSTEYASGRANLVRRVERLVAHLENLDNVVAVSAYTATVMDGMGEEALDVGLILFLNRETGEYVAIYAREGNG
ncbi:MAG: hypothetical protein HY921_06530 [Elusimicrobia bacterium]|nr:hypothetical protein [Elusimicrobiota bacterium]